MARKTFGEIASHFCPDIDSAICCWLLKKWGGSHFPGIAKAKLIFWPAGPAPEMSAEKWRIEKGVLAVDVGHGIYDHHNPELSRHNQCSADLVAQAIGRILDPALQGILEVCRLQDSSAKGYKTYGDKKARMFNLINLINGWNLLYPESPEKVIDLAGQSLEAIYAMEEDTLQAEKDFRHLKEKEAKMSNGDSVIVAYIVSSTRQIDRVIREEMAGAKKPVICVVDNPRLEQTRIIAPRNIDLRWVAVRLRLLEAWFAKAKLSEVALRIDSLTALGTHPEIPAFHFAFPNLILNRSPKNPLAPRMRIFPEKLLGVVVEALENRLPQNQPCSEDKPCLKGRCPYYLGKLRKCGEYRKRRWEEYQARKTREAKSGDTPHLKIVSKKEGEEESA